MHGPYIVLEHDACQSVSGPLTHACHDVALLHVVLSGVYRDQKQAGKPWGACISLQDKNKNLGRYATGEAARAYDRAIHKYGKPRSWLNFPPEAQGAASAAMDDSDASQAVGVEEEEEADDDDDDAEEEEGEMYGAAESHHEKEDDDEVEEVDWAGSCTEGMDIGEAVPCLHISIVLG